MAHSKHLFETPVHARPMLPEEIREFLLKYIDSVAELEGLLLLRRERDTAWTESALAQRLFITERAAADVLRALHRRGFLAEQPGGFRYEPVAPALADTVDTLASLYSTSLIPMTHVIHSKPPTALKEFADAFRLRERKP